MQSDVKKKKTIETNSFKKNYKKANLVSLGDSPVGV